jgi:hypothetical protein
MKQAALTLLFVLLSFAAGFYLGRRSVVVKETTAVEYQPMPTVSVTISAPEPIRFTVPDLPQWLYFTDTVTHTQHIDTAAILADWILRREYAGRLINDTTGTVDYLATVQYNRLQTISLDYTPIQRTVTTTRTIQPRFTPFVLVGANTAGFGQVETGVLFRKWGASVELGTDYYGKYYVGGKVGVRF